MASFKIKSRTPRVGDGPFRLFRLVQLIVRHVLAETAHEEAKGASTRAIPIRRLELHWYRCVQIPELDPLWQKQGTAAVTTKQASATAHSCRRRNAEEDRARNNFLTTFWGMLTANTEG